MAPCWTQPTTIFNGCFSQNFIPHGTCMVFLCLIDIVTFTILVGWLILSPTSKNFLYFWIQTPCKTTSVVSECQIFTKMCIGVWGYNPIYICIKHKGNTSRKQQVKLNKYDERWMWLTWKIVHRFIHSSFHLHLIKIIKRQTYCIMGM